MRKLIRAVTGTLALVALLVPAGRPGGCWLVLAFFFFTSAQIAFSFLSQVINFREYVRRAHREKLAMGPIKSIRSGAIRSLLVALVFAVAVRHADFPFFWGLLAAGFVAAALLAFALSWSLEAHPDRAPAQASLTEEFLDREVRSSRWFRLAVALMWLAWFYSWRGVYLSVA